MTHFHLYPGRIQGTNGKLTLDAPWPDYMRDESINVPADPFVKAFEMMINPDISIRDEFLHVTQGKMKVKIPINVDHFPVTPKPDYWDPMDDSMLPCARFLRPFISEDASRPWACSLLYRGGYLYATNNVVMVRTPWSVGSLSEVEEFTFPAFGVDQVLRTQKSISGMQITENAVHLELEGDVWIKSVRYVEKWPNVEKMFDKFDYKNLPRLSGEEHGIVEKLLPFVPDKRHPVIRFMNDKIATMDGDMEAAVEISCDEAVFHATPLLDVLKVATHMDFNHYPAAVPFRGNQLDGMIMGVKI
jgi:hypothetical protein